MVLIQQGVGIPHAPADIPAAIRLIQRSIDFYGLDEVQVFIFRDKPLQILYSTNRWISAEIVDTDGKRYPLWGRYDGEAEAVTSVDGFLIPEAQDHDPAPETWTDPLAGTIDPGAPDKPATEDDDLL